MKKTISFLVFIICFFYCTINLLKAQSLKDSLILYYSWDSTIFDQSGNGFDPISFSATFATDRNGNKKCALYFNGINNYIVLPGENNLQPPLPFSFSLWFKYDNLLMENSALFTNDFTEESHSGIWMNLNSANPSLRLSYGNATTYGPTGRKTFSTNKMMEANIWYFVVGIVEGLDDIKIYIDGIEQAGYYEGSANELVYVGHNGNIGRKDANYSNDPYYFKGYMDEFRYWKRVITKIEIDSLYFDLDDITINDTIIYDSIDQDKLEQKFHFFPNPFKDWLNISSNISEEYSLEITDIVGRKISSFENIKRIYLNVSPGMYVIKVKTNTGKLFIGKVIKH